MEIFQSLEFLAFSIVKLYPGSILVLSYPPNVIEDSKLLL